MAHTYAISSACPTTGLRFFTVYGPWGRPDMALFMFTKAILEGRPIDVFNHGRMRRDFTYIDDIVEGVIAHLDQVARSRSRVARRRPGSGARAGRRTASTTSATTAPVELSYVIALIEKELGREAKMNLLPMQPGDVPATCADVDDLMRDVGFRPATPIEEGVGRFVSWYRSFYRH